MTKKIIRLTEGDLHRIIKESVNNVLTELNWKTYANAANKRAEQGNEKKATDLSNYAMKAFSDEHNNGSPFVDDYNDTEDIRNRATTDFHISPYHGRITDTRSVSERGKGIDDASNTCRYTYREKPSFENEGKPTQPMSKRSGKYIDTLGKMHNDMKRYYGGESKYIKGKGWQ